MKAKINHVDKLAAFNIFELVTENITLSNGVTTDIHILRHPGASAVIPLTATGGVLMLKQYRHAVGRTLWEIPAGTFDAHETALACAQRELVEETGYRALQWHRLGEITPVPAWSDECIHLYLATDLIKTQQHLEDDELLEVYEMKWDDALEKIYRGEIRDAKTICAFMMAGRRTAGPTASTP